MSTSDSVGTLLAAIANLIADGLRILNLADKRHWGPDEHEQVQALAAVLDDAKRDFQELSPLVNGQIYYESDRKHESLEDLRAVQAKFTAHVASLREWSRSGGPIDPSWVRDTQLLKRQLHRAQCRAARRIFNSEKESSERCLGAFLVYREQRKWVDKPAAQGEGDYAQRFRDELAACNEVGAFQRFGDQDVAFVCDYCDGHIIWQDLNSMPSIRTFQEAAASPIFTLSPTPTNPHWQATGFTLTGHEEKQIVFAAVAIANHVAPQHRDYIASLLCPYCEVEGEHPQEDDDEDGYRPDLAYDDMEAFHEHLAWQHTTAAPTSKVTKVTDSCTLM